MSSADHRLISFNHIESFNFFLGEGLSGLVKSLKPLRISSLNHEGLDFGSLTITVEQLRIGVPTSKPFEARLSGSNYSAGLQASISIQIDEDPAVKRTVSLGSIPMMLLSRNCLLSEARALADFKEDDNEPGGYFIVNGLEKILRSIIVARKNYPLGIQRATFSNRRKNFSPFAVSIKSVADNYSAQTINLHYAVEGNVYMSIMLKKVEYVIPLGVILRALIDASDEVLARLLCWGEEGFNGVVIAEDLARRGLRDQRSCLRYLGYLLRNVMDLGGNKEVSDEEAGRQFIDDHVLVHLGKASQEKAGLLGLMTHKLWLLAGGKLRPDDLDSMSNQEVLTSGQLYGLFFKERMAELLSMVKAKLLKDYTAKDRSSAKNLQTPLLERIEKAFAVFEDGVGKKIEHLLATGNLKSRSGLDLMQNNGLSIIAERLNNARFWSHLRSVHRGAYFVEMKTTKVRKLLPENWGFLCPVHTPDGGLCGLLNHLAMGCLIQPSPALLGSEDLRSLARICVEFGMSTETLGLVDPNRVLPVVFDGRLLGQVARDSAKEFCRALRRALKHPETGLERFRLLSIFLQDAAPELRSLSLLPGIFLSLSEGRPLRQVFNEELGFVEWIDPLEQTGLLISISESEPSPSATHRELDVNSVLSELAAQIPFMVHNQSPRTMYQCQMAKQTMGTSTLALAARADNKMYRVSYPQLPLVRSSVSQQLGFSHYPSGANAIVAVLAYTGYDIEDAMVINKSSYERGFMHGSVHKTVIMDLADGKREKKPTLALRGGDVAAPARRPDPKARADINALRVQPNLRKKVEQDGLPLIGQTLNYGDQEAQFQDLNAGQPKTKYFKDQESCFVDSVMLASNGGNSAPVVNLKLRYNRNPVVGDKFSSRHGQKGVMSFLWPQSDMPFTESGITPDVIINPNAFPSRMTIGMLIESMAGKLYAQRGAADPTSAFDRKDWADIGEKLEREGFNKLGTDVMYSGVFGTPFKVEIFQGVVFYQRLRHMIKDKAQARSTGPVDSMTRQPIKGRKRGGGIRLGEMERDALIAHGTSFILKERLMDSSDASDAVVCRKCGNLLGCFQHFKQAYRKFVPRCLECEDRKQEPDLADIKIPYVLRYLTNELAAMNIKVEFNL